MKNNKPNKSLQEALKYLKQLPFNPCESVKNRATHRLVMALEAYLTHQQQTKQGNRDE